MKKVLITTVPFGEKNRIAIEMLEEAGIEYLVNPLGRKLSEKELALMVSDFDVIIAGTEEITDDVMENGKNLKLISRVGIGLDSVDLLAAERRGIKVSYTPDAPAPAVTVASTKRLLIKSPLREIVQVTRRPKSAWPLKVCSMDSIAKLVWRRYVTFQKVI